MSKRFWGVTVAAVAAALLFAAPASATTFFSSGGAATIPNSGPASLYGMTTNVSGTTGLITDIKFGLLDVTHANLGDIGAVLVSPEGQAFEVLDGLDGCAVSNITLTFDDAASGLVPQTCPLASGTYKPTVRIFGLSESYPAPGPLLAYENPGPAGGGTATLDGTFGGYLANGAWQLYIYDFDVGQGGGSVDQWDMAVTTGTPDATLTPNPVPNGFHFSQRDPVEAAGPTQTFTTTNTGSTPLHIDSAFIGGADHTQFAITEDNCSLVRLAPTGTCTVKVAFNPDSLGGKSAQLGVQIADVGTPSVELSGTGSLLSSFDSPTFGFGSRDVASGPTAAHAFHFSNDSADVDVHVSDVALSGANPGEFGITSNLCTGTVTPGNSCEVDVTFDPTSAGSKAATLAVTSDAPTPVTNAQLSGQGTVAPPPSNPQTPTTTNTPTVVAKSCKKKKSRAVAAKKCKKKRR